MRRFTMQLRSGLRGSRILGLKLILVVIAASFGCKKTTAPPPPTAGCDVGAPSSWFGEWHMSANVSVCGSDDVVSTFEDDVVIDSGESFLEALVGEGWQVTSCAGTFNADAYQVTFSARRSAAGCSQTLAVEASGEIDGDVINGVSHTVQTYSGSGCGVEGELCLDIVTVGTR